MSTQDNFFLMRANEGTEAKRLVEGACDDWGRSKREIIIAGDGWPKENWLAKVRRDREGAGQSGGVRRGGHYPEVWRGEAIRVARAQQYLTEKQRVVLYAHYVVTTDVAGNRLHAKTKCFRLGLSRREYYRQLEAAHQRILALWDVGMRLKP